MPRDHDLILFGATGFVGRLTAEHVAAHAPAGARVALAGRSPRRLEQVRSSFGPVAADWPTLEADASSPADMRRLAGSTRAVVSTVGPYLRHGIPLVEACAEAGTDYADLTGEVLFVREIVDRFHETARGSGARIVVSCGFDSVPSDLAVHLLHQQAAADGAGDLTDTTLRVKVLKGGLSGGTIDSMRLQLRAVAEDPALRRFAADPEALSGAVPGAPGQRDVWTPFVDAETGRWDAPFVMAPYNTRLVRRSNALLGRGYGEAFRYREVTPTGVGLKGRLRAQALTAGLGALMTGMSTPGLRSVVDRVLPSPGQGPSEEARRAGRFRMETSTRTTSGARYVATVAAQGDPGYSATSVMLGQSGLALAVDRDQCSPEGGVLTPAVAMGDVLVERLHAQGFGLSVREVE
ncbi:saccharopine dehydrogenase family protein [Ornithinimicrobium panacihumi]|uniref:saccharopine dehydrogenase family protein n=1 Tax=Ornithinimicrobium panacihumi TaxID=2008449 RepID=UPI003F8A0579